MDGTVAVTYGLQLAGALAVAAILGRMYRAHGRGALRDWYRSFLAHAAYAALAAVAFLLASRVAPWHPLRLAVSFAALCAGYLQVVWLVSGTWALKTGREVPERIGRRLVAGAVAAAALLVLAWVWDPGAATARLVARVGVRSAVAGVAFWAASVFLLRRGGWRAGIGVRVLGIALALYGTDQLRLLVFPIALLVRGAPPEYGALGGRLDLVLLLAVGLGLVMWFLDEERERALRISGALREREETYRLIARQTGQILYDHDPGTDRVRWAGAIREVTGLPEEAFAGASMADWEVRIHPEDRRAATETKRVALARGERFRVEYRYRRDDGRWLAIEERGVLAAGGPGPARVLGVLGDVTERRESEAGRARLEARLLGLRRLESLGRLAGGVAHDFNNLLTPVMGYAEILAAELPPDDPGRADLGAIRDAAREAVDLARQLLAFGRKLALELRPTDLNEVVDRFHRVLRRILRADIAIELRLAHASWSVQADPVQIEHVLLDLALNAQDAMPDGGILTIATENVTVGEAEARSRSGLSPGSWVRITVSDTGLGMTGEEVEKIFEPFYSTKERGRGRGLGLATVYGIVKQHGGGIWASSEHGRGSSFAIYLPRATDAPEPAPEEAGGLPRGDETVLVVEDDASVRRLVCGALTAQGYRVLEAPSAERALELAAGHPGEIHLLLADVILTGSRGPELYRRLREQRPGLRGLFTSGYADEVAAVRELVAAGGDFLAKPFSVHALVHRVRAVLDG